MRQPHGRLIYHTQQAARRWAATSSDRRHFAPFIYRSVCPVSPCVPCVSRLPRLPAQHFTGCGKNLEDHTDIFLKFRLSRSGKNPHSSPSMSYPEKISAPLLAPDANSIEMAVSPAGAAAVDPDKTNATRTLFKNMSPRRGAKESDNDKNCTPTTGEKRATRGESHRRTVWLRPERDAGADLQNPNWKDRRAAAALDAS